MGGADEQTVCDCGRCVDFACFPSCRAALSLSFVRYCRCLCRRCCSILCLFRHRPCVVITPAGHVRHASRHASLVEERGGATGRLRAAGCSDVIASLLAYPMPFPRLGRFGSHPSHPRRLVRFASMHVPTEVRSAAVRMPCGRLCLLPRLSVSIVFKMFSCQSFKILRLFGIARLGEYRRRSCPIASPSHLRFAPAVSG